MIIIFVEFIDQLIDYPINCASISDQEVANQVRQHSLAEIDHEIFSKVILSIPLI